MESLPALNVSQPQEERSPSHPDTSMDIKIPTEISKPIQLASSPDSTSNLPINPIVNSSQAVYIESEICFEEKQKDDSFHADLSSEVGYAENDFNLPDQVTEITSVERPNVESSFFVSTAQDPENSEEIKLNEAAPLEASSVPSSELSAQPVFVEKNPLMMPLSHALLHFSLVCSTNTPLLRTMM